MVVDLDLARRHLVETLADDTQRLTEFFDAAQVSVVAVTVLADGHVKLDLVVRVIRGDFSVFIRVAGNHASVNRTPTEKHGTGKGNSDVPDIPRNSGTTEHDTRERVVERLLRRHGSNADRALLPDTVARHDLFNLVDSVRERRRPLVDVLEESVREIVRNPSRAHVRGVEPRARDTLVELHELLTLFETPQERREGSDIYVGASRVSSFGGGGE